MSRWEARRPGFRVNRSRTGQRLVNLWISQHRFSACCGIDTGDAAAPTTPPIRFTGQRLNLARLNSARRSCGYRFRQQDLLSAVAAAPRYLANLFVVLEWPAPPTARLDSAVTANLTSAANLATLTRRPASA